MRPGRSSRCARPSCTRRTHTVSYAAIVAAASRRGESALGYRIGRRAVTLNPRKSARVTPRARRPGARARRAHRAAQRHRLPRAGHVEAVAQRSPAEHSGHRRGRLTPRDRFIHLPVRSRCLHPGQQQGRRWPSSSSSWVRRMRRSRVFCCLASSTQQMNSLRASGVMSCQAVEAVVFPTKACRRSDGSRAPPRRARARWSHRHGSGPSAQPHLITAGGWRGRRTRSPQGRRAPPS